MFDINAIVNAAITEAVNARITEVLQQHANTVAALAEKIAALEDSDEFVTNRIARLEAAAPQPAITIDEAKMVEALNSQEWFWEKLQNRIDAATESAIDDHCSTYDHDSYDEMASKVYETDFDDFVTNDSLEDAVREAVGNLSFDISVS